MNKSLQHDADFQFVSVLRDSYWLLREIIDTRLEPMGLSQARWRPLLVLYLNEGPMTQVELARKLSLESPTVVRLLDRLGEHGWIERCPCPKDRRAYHVELTPKARRLCVDINCVVTEVRRQGLAGIPPQDLAMAISVLERARDGFARLADELKTQETVAPGRRKTSAATRGRTRKAKPNDKSIE